MKRAIILLLLLILNGCTQEIILEEPVIINETLIIEVEEPSPNLNNTQEIILEENKITENNSQKQPIKEKSLYKPKIGISWQWQLADDIDISHNVDMYVIDLEETPQTIIDELHSRNIKVICYISAGSWEEYRTDADKFPKEIIGKTLDGWPEEKWLDISNYEKFSSIIITRMNLAVQKKCDGIEPDNIDGYQNKNGFDLTYKDQLTYNKWLAEEAHKRGLAIALKNDLEQIKELEEYFDFAINEQCFEYDECVLLLPFIEAGKPVLGVSYGFEKKKYCDEANEMKFSWLIKEEDYTLDARSRIACNT